jgi:RNA:NAD 2'-phosphotransferase (TPT1/KptA family)
MPHCTFKEFLSEAKFSKPIIAYHATKVENVQSILKHGLIPNKKDDGWGSEDHNMDVGISLKALSGIYFTDSAEAVIDIASEIGYKDGAIVICKIQRKMAAMDEDDLDKILESLYRDLRKIVIKINKSDTINNF